MADDVVCTRVKLWVMRMRGAGEETSLQRSDGSSNP